MTQIITNSTLRYYGRTDAEIDQGNVPINPIVFDVNFDGAKATETKGCYYIKFYVFTCFYILALATCLIVLRFSFICKLKSSLFTKQFFLHHVACNYKNHIRNGYCSLKIHSSRYFQYTC